MGFEASFLRFSFPHSFALQLSKFLFFALLPITKSMHSTTSDSLQSFRDRE